MVTIDSLRDELDELGFNPANDVLERCLEMCKKHDVRDPVDFAERWMAFTVSKCGGAEPDIPLLKEMESYEFGNTTRASTSKKFIQQIQEATPELIVYGNNESTFAEDDVVDSYVCRTPKAKRPLPKMNHHTPVNTRAVFSPASYSPITTPGKLKNPDLPNSSGNVVYTFGSSTLVKNTNWTSTQKSSTDVDIKLSPLNSNYVNGDSKYMYDSLYERSLILGDRIYDVGQDICNKLKTSIEASTSQEEEGHDDKLEIKHVDFQTQDQFYCMGRIICGDGNNVGIIGCDEMKLRSSSLDFSRMKSWAVFPGETVIIKGTNPRGNQIFVEEIHAERQLQMSGPPVGLKTEVSFVVAAAPFTQSEDLLYEKLTDLLNYCSTNQPDVLILTGPIADSRVELFGEIAEEFYDYFEKIISNIMNTIGAQTQVIVVASHEDIVSTFVYPTHPYESNISYKNLRFVSDPCIVDVNGIQIGLTSVDVLKHLADLECSGNVIKDVKRFFNHLFHQKSFYPINPPSDSTPVDVDLLNELAKINQIPNLMICPSDLNVFVREINSCVCLNPGRLCSGENGGTFSRFVVHPPKAAETKPFNYIACQVVKS